MIVSDELLEPFKEAIMGFLAEYPEMKLVSLETRKHPYISVERVNFEAFFRAVGSRHPQRLYLNSSNVAGKLATFFKDTQSYSVED